MKETLIAFALRYRYALLGAGLILLLGIGIWLLGPSLAAAPQATPTPLLNPENPNNPGQPTVNPALNTALLCPNPECVVVTPGSPNPEILQLNLPTPGEEPISAWRPALYPVPWGIGPHDHFYFTRPIGADEVNWPLTNYRYGGVFFEEVTHTGVDIPAKPGTPVRAAGPGTITWAGWGLFSGEPGNIEDPYGQAVAIRHDFGYGSEPLFTIYAHMEEVDVVPGQWVDTGAHLGEVGDTGYTTGPHLHFEVRVGGNNYYQTRNPELWIAPPQGWGVLAGRIMDSDRSLIKKAAVTIRAIPSDREWVVYTYGPEAVRPDPYYNENMVISDLPAGRYVVSLIFEGRTRRVEVEIRPGQVSYFSFRGEFGFNMQLPNPPGMEKIFTPTPLPSTRPKP